MSANAKPPPRKPALPTGDPPPRPGRDRTNPGGPDPLVLAAARSSEDATTESVAAAGDATLIYDKNKGRARGEPARLIVIGGPRAGSEFQLTQVETSIGRGSENVLVIPDISVSRRHVVLQREGESYVLLDQGSGNGTRVNGRQVTRHPLVSGDEIAMGDTVVQFVAPGGVLVRGAGPRRGSTAPGLPPGEGAKGRGAIRVGGSALLAEEKPEVTQSKAPGLKKRAPLYAVLFVAVLAILGAGLFRRNQRAQRAEEAARDGEGGRAFARQRFDEAVRLIKEGRWPEARDKLKVAAELDSQDEEIARDLAHATLEAPRSQAVKAARDALSRNDFAAARGALSGIPDDSALADAAQELQAALRTAMDAAVSDARARVESGDSAGAAVLIDPVLAADPQRSDALAVKEAIGQPRKPRASGKSRHEKPRPPPPEAAATPSGPIIEAYLAGDLGTAIDRADAGQDSRAQRLSKDLKAFDAAYRDGLAKAQAKRAAEAITALERANNLDRGLAGGQDSRLGREVRRALANLHSALGMADAASGNDDALPAAAAHLRAAVAFDPQNEQAQGQLAQVVARARDIYLRGYIAKDSDPETARRAFRLVTDILPASDETAQKAKRWLDKLNGKGPKEEG